MRTKVAKKRPSWVDVKQKITAFDKPGLVQLVSNLYAMSPENRDFLHARFGLGAEPLASYRERISEAIAPDISKRQHKDPSVAAAKKVISEYKKAVGDQLGLVELRVFWCEAAVEFATGFGYEDGGYFDALIRQYRDACFELAEVDEPKRSGLVSRLKTVWDHAEVGYGVQDEMGYWYMEIES